ncbi:MAG TPA: sigma-70 family RNA polymerase sigma factor [Pyrinomonadaceae bacterium]
MQDNGPTDTRGEVDFRKLLEDVKAGREAYYALFDLPVFKFRLNNICNFSTYNLADAEELYNEVLFKISQNIADFEPDFEADEYGKFFRWLAVIARHASCDNLRRNKLEFDDQRPEEILNLADPGISPELAAERAERDRRFRKFITSLESERDRKILEYALEDLSLREVKGRLNAEGISCSHTTVANVIHRVRQFFAEDDLEINLPRKPDKQSLPGSEPEVKPNKQRN